MLSPIKALRAGAGYLRRNPREVLYAARHAMNFRSVVPLDALRWLAENALNGKGAPKDVVIGARPPALTFEATINLMGTKVRAGAAIRIEEIRMSPEEMLIRLRLSDVRMTAMEKSDSPVYTLLASGALDLSKPGNLANYMPKRPPALIEARDDYVVLDLMRDPKLAANPRVRRILNILTPVLPLHDLRTEDDHLVLAWRPQVKAIPRALLALRGA